MLYELCCEAILYVTSKQEDAGDPNPGGGRLVIMDAKNFEK